MVLRRGALEIARVRGIALRVHWTTPLGLFVLGGLVFAPVTWAALLAIIAVHELGHAAIAVRVGCAVQSVEVHGFGGLCRWAGSPSPIGRAAIAWGGVLAQLGVLAATIAVEIIAGAPTSHAGRELVAAFVPLNVLIICFNLLPFGPLDGAEAWPLVPLLARRRRQRRASRRVVVAIGRRAVDEELRRRLAELDRLEATRAAPDLDEVRQSVLRVVAKKKR